MQTDTTERTARQQALHGAIDALINLVALDAVETAAAAPGAIVLPPMGRATRITQRTISNSFIRLEFVDGDGNDLVMYKCHERPNGYTSIRWNPAHWEVNASRKDALGNRWSAFLGFHVMDDFGTLVEVPA